VTNSLELIMGFEIISNNERYAGIKRRGASPEQLTGSRGRSLSAVLVSGDLWIQSIRENGA